MNTFLSESQESLLEEYRAFVKETITPIAWDLTKDNSQTKDILQKLAQAGYLGITVPKEYGGSGKTFIEAVLLSEAIGESEPGICLSLSAHYAVIDLINRYGTDTHKSRYLPLLARGEYIGAIAVNEANAGTDFRAARSKCANDKLDGEKTWVVNADIASIFAVTALYGQAGEQPCLRLVDSPDRNGITFSGTRRIFGLSSAHINDIKFAGYELGKESLLCDDSKADEAIDFAFCVAKTLLAAACVGMVESSTVACADHAKEREQFGQKLSQFQAIQWKLADMSTEAAASRLLTYRAAWSKDAKPEDFKRNAAMCKVFASKAARVHSAEAVQIMGSFGISEDSAVERFYRDAKVMEVLGGTSEAQKLELVKELGV